MLSGADELTTSAVPPSDTFGAGTAEKSPRIATTPPLRSTCAPLIVIDCARAPDDATSESASGPSTRARLKNVCMMSSISLGRNLSRLHRHPSFEEAGRRPRPVGWRALPRGSRRSAGAPVERRAEPVGEAPAAIPPASWSHGKSSSSPASAVPKPHAAPGDEGEAEWGDLHAARVRFGAVACRGIVTEPEEPPRAAVRPTWKVGADDVELARAGAPGERQDHLRVRLSRQRRRRLRAEGRLPRNTRAVLDAD